MIDAILNNLREYWPVHTLLAVYTVMLAHHAWSGKRNTKSLADFYVGGRRMGGVVIGLSFFATYASTNSFVGFSGRTYTWGVPWLLFMPVAVAFCLFAWIVIAPRLRQLTAEMDSLTVADFVGFRFASKPARVAAALIVIAASFFYMTAVFKGIGNLLEGFLDIPYRVAIVVVFFVVMAYTSIGGFISVVKTDAVQGVVMLVAALILFVGTLSAAGGLGALPEVRNQPGGEDLFTWGGGVEIPVLIGVMVAGLVKFAVEPRQLSRFFALEGSDAVRRGMWVSCITFAVVFTLILPVGLYARLLPIEGIVAASGSADTDLVIPALLAEVFGRGTSAFLLVAMVAAAMSSLDSVLLVMASTTERDLVAVARRSHDERKEMMWTRIWVAGFAFVTMLIALNPPGGIVELTAFSGALYGACFLPSLVFGLHWRRGNGRSVVASFAVGVIVLLGWERVPGSDVIHEIFPAMALSAAAFVAVAMLSKPTGDSRALALIEGEAQSIDR